jgi:hypothetical protein
VSAPLPRGSNSAEHEVSQSSVGQVARNCHHSDERRMSSIRIYGDTFQGISVDGRGVFTDKYSRRTYAGQHRNGYACGLGVFTWPSGSKDYAEYGPDGKYDGLYLDRWTDGNIWYRLFERGKSKAFAVVFVNGSCLYDSVFCAPDDPRLLALIAQVAPVEVRPAAPAPHPLLGPPLAPKQSSNAPARFAAAGAREDYCHRGAPPRRTLSLVAVRHIPTTSAMQSTTMQ